MKIRLSAEDAQEIAEYQKKTLYDGNFSYKTKAYDGYFNLIEDNIKMARNDNRYCISSTHLNIDNIKKTFTISYSDIYLIFNERFYWPVSSLDEGKKLGDKYPLIEIRSAESGSHATMTLFNINEKMWEFRPTTGTIAKRHPQLKGWVLRILK